MHIDERHTRKIVKTRFKSIPGVNNFREKPDFFQTIANKILDVIVAHQKLLICKSHLVKGTLCVKILCA